VCAPTDPADGRQIENLNIRYAELVDDGDFTGVGKLLSEATVQRILRETGLRPPA